jgi:hypothetical protein
MDGKLYVTFLAPYKIQNGDFSLKIEIRKIGLFYNAFDDDAQIMHFLFGYKIKENRCGFPLNALNKVINTLEDKKISYEIIGESKNDFKDLNTYNKYLEKAIDKLKINNRINNILERLNNLDKDKLCLLLTKFESLIDEV